MIRRDYIIRMIEAFGQALARIRALKGERRWDEAGGAVDEEARRSVGLDPKRALELSDTELMAALIEGESTQTVRDKAWFLATLLKEAGDVAAAQEKSAEADAYYVKALRILLQTLHGEDAFEFPEFVPRIEELLEGISPRALTLETRALLMEHYETTGQFAKAEDMLFSILDNQPTNPDFLQFGRQFYERISRQSDERLALGDLPRAEVDAGAAELRARSPKGQAS